MHNDQNTRKAVSAGTLVGRAFFICLAFLIIPLFVHSFFQYRTEMELKKQEIQLQERDVRATLRVIAEQMSDRIEDFIELDWKLLTSSVAAGSLDELFNFRQISVEAGLTDQFVIVDEAQQELLVGKKISEQSASVIVHQLSDLIALKSAPFLIAISLNEPLSDTYVEEVLIPNTELHIRLGSNYTGIFHLHKNNFILRIISFLTIIGLLGGGLVYLLLKKLAKPLNVLRLTMDRVAQGAVYSRYVNQRFGFEVNAIGQYFNETVDALLSHQKQAEAEKIQKERLAEKFLLAQTIQADLLPKKIPTAPHLDIGAAYLPALEVGGDFYDILPLSGGKILIVVADIADKGISACLFSLGLRSSLRALAEAKQGDIAEIIQLANDLFMLDAEETSQFATLWVGILDKKTLSYLSMGHPPALLKRDGSIRELSTSHPSLGLFALQELTPSQVELQRGDELLIFSDGVTEAHDQDALLFGKDRLMTAFSRVSRGTAEAVSRTILEDVQSFSYGAEQHDDVTILVVKIN